MSNEHDNEEELTELIRKYRDQEGITSNEGARGVNNFEKLCKAIGYDKNGAFINASPILNFLSDNSGAIEALIEWIGDTRIPEWADDLREQLPDDMSDVEDEEEEGTDEK